MLLLAVTPLAAARAGPPQAGGTTPANTARDAHSDEVVVLGLSQTERERAIGGFVRALTVVTPDGPLPLFEPDIYCPVAFGLSDERNEEIATRMRRVAAAVGVKPAPPGCVPSAFVFFVDDKAAFLKAFSKRQPVFFGTMSNAALRPEKGPTSSWQLTQDMTPEKVAAPKASFKGAFTGEVKVVSSYTGGSRIISLTTAAIAAAVVVIERKALVGLSPTQIADYALMRTLVDKPPSDTGNLAQLSVLGVIAAPLGSETPLSLTPWDFTYVKMRYAGDPRFQALRKTTAIRTALRKQTAGGRGSAAPQEE